MKDDKTSVLTVLSISFTALSATATVSTLIIAVLLYQKLNIDSILVERQTNKVLELVDFLKGRVIYIGFKEYEYFSRFNIDDKSLFSSKHYLEMAGLALITRKDDLDKFFGKLVDMSYSYWMPQEIKAKMGFFNITGYFKNIPQGEIKNYAKLKFDGAESKNDEWLLITPNLAEFRTDPNQLIKLEEAEFLVNDYITSKNNLIEAIVKWLGENSNIKIDIAFNEPNQTFVAK